MKRIISSRKMGMIVNAVLAAAVVGVLAQASRGDDAPAAMGDRVSAAAGKQEDIRGQIDKVRSQMAVLIDKFERNGMGGGRDVQVLKNVHDALDSLSETQMTSVIAMLNQAQHATTDEQAKTSVSSAYTQQMTIATQMQQILIATQLQADLLDVATQFSLLSKRQNENFKQAKHLARAVAGKQSLDEGQAAVLRVQQAEQDSIREEVRARMERLAEIIRKTDDATTNQITSAMEQVTPEKVLAMLQTASSQLRQGRVLQGAVSQRTARDMLRELARVVSPPRKPTQVVADAIEALTSIQARYQQAMDHAEKFKGNKLEGDDQLTLDDEQADLVDEVNAASQDVGPYAPLARDPLGVAIKQMQEARLKTNGGNAAAAAEAGRVALAPIETARKALVDQLALMQRHTESATKLNEAQKLKTEMEELLTLEKTLHEDTERGSVADVDRLKNRQGDIAQKLAGERPFLVAASPEASASANTAFDQMTAAVKTLTGGSTNDALAPEQGAIDGLTDAISKLGAKVEQLKQEDAMLKRLRELRVALSKIVVHQQQLEVATAIGALKSAPNTNGASRRLVDIPAPHELSPDQHGLTTQTQAIRGSLPDVVPEVGPPLDLAASAMEQAVGSMTADAAGPSQDAQKESVKQLKIAIALLDKKIQKSEQNLNSQDSQQQQADQAQAKIANAMQQIAAAQQNLASDQFQNALLNLNAAMTTVAQAQDLSSLSPEAQAALDKAFDHLANSAADAAQQQKSEAQKEADAAAAALADAQKQLDQAQQQAEQQASAAAALAEQDDKPSKPSTKRTVGKMKPPGEMDVTPGEIATVTGANKVSKLPPNGQAAIQQSASEQVPAAYAPQIRQYMTNLAEDGEK